MRLDTARLLVVTLSLLLLAATAAASGYQEAPVLADRVAAGELPPVEERLPDNPFVMTTLSDPAEAQYGGTLRIIHTDPVYFNDASILNLEYIMVPSGHDGSLDFTAPMVPGLIEHIESDDEAKVFTFHMREGMKWSDGHPLTTEDVAFTYHDILKNTALTPVFPANLRINGEPFELDVIDDYTFTVTFADTYGGFIDHLASRMVGYSFLFTPKHYLKQYHADYTSLEELKPLLDEEELDADEWWNLFNAVRDRAVDIPTLSPWVMVQRGADVVVWERNPYYHRVDEAGNQLPYIDRLQSTLVADADMFPIKIVSGDVDFVLSNILLSQMGFYVENQERGGYRLEFYQSDIYNGEIFLNLSHPDPVWNEVVNDVRFRQALNMAIDRDEIIDSIHYSFAAKSERSPQLYDPDEAARLLDEMGLDERDSDGWRLGPDGERFVIPFEIPSLMGWEPPMTELLVEYWEDLGIRTTMTTISATLWFTRGQANELKATAHWNASTNALEIDRPYAREMMPDFIRSWGAGYREWYDSGGAQGEEPPQMLQDYFALYDQVTRAPTVEERTAALQEMLRIIHDEILWISISWPQRPSVFSAQLRNTPTAEDAYDAFTQFYLGMQFYFAD